MQELSQGVPISIHLTTNVRQGDQSEDFLFDLQGQAVKIGDTLYIRYKEIQPDGEEIPVTMKIMPDGVIQLIRSGEMRMRLKFSYKERLETSYQTPYGMMMFHTFTHHLHVSLKDRPYSGKVDIEYDLFMAADKIGEYKLALEFTA
ncbi:DUF1934 domain-containing protein [Enterococcus sp. DIV0876]|uniref:DUF1934 domain-containing protein n=1 Tax=Enterococcus sp. DIV0876 TaxID=2774633 RepID=UPI003D30027E